MKKLLIITLLTISTLALAQQQMSLLDSARFELRKMHYSKAFKKLNSAKLETDQQRIEHAYLKAEVYLILGRTKFHKQMQILDSLGADEYADILRLKHALFIGAGSYDSLVKIFTKKYPRNHEIKFCHWLNKLDKGAYEYCKKSASKISEKILFGFAPYLALYNVAWDKNHKEALAYLDTMEMITGKFHQSKYRKLLEINSNLKCETSTKAIIEMPYAKCGPGIGLLIEDSNGDTIKMELDTGTGYGWMTIHDSLTGQALPGIDTVTIKDGIWYNYMDHAEDFNFKLTSFNKPFYKNILVGHFNGKFSKADGCFSPFFFEKHALQFDPIHQKAYLRTEKNLEQYKQQNKHKITTVPYSVRNGWIFIPCKINDKEVMMMVETGSRDVNFNEFSTEYLNLNVYESSIEWRGKDYPTKKVDCTITIGDNIHYQVNGGLVSDFVLGNHYYGVASAGDLGPEFFKNFIFTIDPFNREMILEQP